MVPRTIVIAAHRVSYVVSRASWLLRDQGRRSKLLARAKPRNSQRMVVLDRQRTKVEQGLASNYCFDWDPFWEDHFWTSTSTGLVSARNIGFFSDVHGTGEGLGTEYASLIFLLFYQSAGRPSQLDRTWVSFAGWELEGVMDMGIMALLLCPD